MSTTNQTHTSQALEKLIRSGGVLDWGPQRSRLLLRILRLLGEGGPVSRQQADRIGDDIGINRDDAREFLSRVTERDRDDAIVGTMGLTLNETGHRFNVNGHQLYTWCALDTLFLPTLVGQPATIESESPVTKEKVRLTVGPEGVRSVDPLGATVSIVLVDADSPEMSSVEAIWTAFCYHVFFFPTRRKGETWAAEQVNRDALEIVSVDEAFSLGQILASTLLAQGRGG